MAEPITSLPNGLNIGTSNTGAALQIDATEVTATATELNQYTINAQIADISTAGSYWVVAPHAGSIAKIYTVVNGAFSTADAAITFEIGGTAVTSGGITITQSGSAAGDVDSSTPSAANVVTAGQAIEIITDGASTDTTTADVSILITR